MFKKDILKGGKKELEEIKSKVEAWEKHEQELKILDDKVKKANKNLEKQKTEMQKAIDSAIKEARDKIENSYNEKLELLKRESRANQNKLENARKEKTSEIKKEETREFLNKKENADNQINEIINQNRMPGFAKSSAFFALYRPSGIDFILLIGIFIVMFGLLPLSMYYVFFKERGLIALACIYVVLEAIVFIIYLLINNLVKEKYLSEISQIGQIRKERRTIVNEMHKKEKEIEKDGKSETEEETKIKTQFAKQIADVENEKKKRLEEFDKDLDNAEYKSIKENINKEKEMLYASKIKDAQSELDTVETELKEEAGKAAIIKSLQILKVEYSDLILLDKDILDIKVIDELIGYLDKKEAKNIKEAIDRRKNGEES